MSTKYRLITEYPGSPKLGTMAEIINRTVMYTETDNDMPYYSTVIIDFKKYPEYWEEIVEKNYQILQITLTGSFGHYISNVSEYSDTYINSLLACKGNYIHSVRRLSDGEVFTVGDNIRLNPVGTPVYTIKQIYMLDDSIIFEHDVGSIFLKNAIKSKVLFRTEDGVDIFEKDRPWYVSKDKFKITGTADLIMNINFHPSKNYLYFSTKEAAEEYILMNKSCLSVKDILKRFNGRWSEANDTTLKELVKSKI